MCRIALLYNAPDNLAQCLAGWQANGANKRTTFWKDDKLTLVHSRFDVTTSDFPNEAFPFQDDRYVIHYNGEIYSFREDVFNVERSYPSDVHFCAALLSRHGIQGFLQEVDFQGTFQIHDRMTNETYVVTDQLNTSGCFYSTYRSCLVVAQEFQLVNQALSYLNAPSVVPIHILNQGTYLKIAPDGSLSLVEYRPDAKRVFEGSKFSSEHFLEKAIHLKETLFESTIKRIPVDGPVAVLTGGGVDSALILSFVAQHLREHGELKRLKVFTFGYSGVGASYEDNDLDNTENLLQCLRLEPRQYLTVLPDLTAEREVLFKNKVFYEDARLITPNPILNTQVRHTVRMATVLAEIVLKHPYVKVVLTGDVADELFAGYNSMRSRVSSPLELAQRVKDKLADLPLNDAARFTLASLHGCVAILKRYALYPKLLHLPGMSDLCDRIEYLTQEELRHELTVRKAMTEEIQSILDCLHPVEVRTPFSSHIVLKALSDANPDYLIGRLNQKILPKFLLRVSAILAGVPVSIAMRKKVPFNEGGSGIRNSDRDWIENRSAQSWELCDEAVLKKLLDVDRDYLIQLGIMLSHEDRSSDLIQRRYEQLALYLAAKGCGLGRMLNGNVFRVQMPDCIYATEELESSYRPNQLISFESNNKRVSVI